MTKTNDATYEGYWNAVLSPHLDAAGVVSEYELASGSESEIDCWLGVAEAAAWNADGGKAADMPEDWRGFHTQALAELVAAAAAAEPEPAPRMMPGQKPYTPEERARLNQLLTDAAAASEQIPEHELEDHAARQRAKPPPPSDDPPSSDPREWDDPNMGGRELEP